MSRMHIEDSDRLAEFHNELERVARQYKQKYQITSIPNTFAFEFIRLARKVEFELLDTLVSKIQSVETTEVSQQFVLGVLKGEVRVSDDRYENLVYLAKQYLQK